MDSIIQKDDPVPTLENSVLSEDEVGSVAVKGDSPDSSRRCSSRLSGPLLLSLFLHGLLAVLIIIVSLKSWDRRRAPPVPTIALVNAPASMQEPVRADLPPAPAKAATRAESTPQAVSSTVQEATPSPSATTARDSSSGAAQAAEGVPTGEITGTSAVPSPSAGATGSRGQARIGSVAQLDNTDFDPIYHPDPAYPPIARAAGITGYTDVDLVIDEKGKVRECKVVSISGHPSFGTEALKVMPTWRFPPPRINGKPARIVYLYRVRFKLN